MKRKTVGTTNQECFREYSQLLKEWMADPSSSPKPSWKEFRDYYMRERVSFLVDYKQIGGWNERG